RFLLFTIAGLLLVHIPLRAAEATFSVLIEKEGKVEIARKGSTTRAVGQVNDKLQIGDRLRTGSHSRATLRWSELSFVRVSELSSMEVQPPTKTGGKPQMELRSGTTYFFSR